MKVSLGPASAHQCLWGTNQRRPEARSTAGTTRTATFIYGEECLKKPSDCGAKTRTVINTSGINQTRLTPTQYYTLQYLLLLPQAFNQHFSSSGCSTLLLADVIGPTGARSAIHELNVSSGAEGDGRGSGLLKQLPTVFHTHRLVCSTFLYLHAGDVHEEEM